MKLLSCLAVTLSLCHFCRTQQEQPNETVIDPDQIEVLLYTRLNTAYPDLRIPINDIWSLVNSPYNPSNPLAVIIHGYKGSGNESAFLHIKDAYLSRGEWNVLLLDWSPLSKVNRYVAAVHNGDKVAELFAEFLNDLISKDFANAKTTHLVGFSIGAHIAGLIGKRVNETLAKIFALDPAFPMYHLRDRSGRLDVNDAEFVQVIHTSGDLISFEDNIGHVDFYPNSGKLPQPICLHPHHNTSRGRGLVSVIVCSHKISVYYFAASVMYENRFIAEQCHSWDDYVNKTCTGEKVIMGYETPISARGNYYLNILKLHNYEDDENR